MQIDPEKWIASPFVIGSLGALVGLRFAPGATWAGRAANVTAGALCAGFIAPALAEIVHIATPGMSSALSFAVGLFGLSAASAIATALRELKLGEIISGWISRRG
jgi:hypothetical protein